MGTVGLLYVGAVLFINGMMLLGRVDPRAAGIFNLFVGALQVVVPTALLVQAGSDPAKILSAAGIYLFGFTYLYVGVGLLTDADSTGVGWYSLFVAIVALGFSFLNFRVLGDRPFGVIWLYWAFLWLLFFLLLGLKKDELGWYTGLVTVVEAWVTCAIPALLILGGYWRNTAAVALVLAVVGVAMAAGLWPVARRHRQMAPAPAADLNVHPDDSARSNRAQRR